MNSGEPVTRVAAIRAQQRVTVSGVIRQTAPETVGTSRALRCVLADGSGEIDLVFLGRAEIADLRPGTRCAVHGTACVREGRLVLWSPRYEISPVADEDNLVLVLDGDPAMARVLEVSLTANGFRVETATTVAAAVLLALHGPDVVIVDLALPDGDGIEAISVIRETCASPVIALSARNGEEEKRAALAVGAAEYIAKPFHSSTLVSRVTARVSPGQAWENGPGDPATKRTG